LAYHWQKVVETGQKDDQAITKALDYLEKAGEQALERYANQEAIEFFSGALKIAEAGDGTKPHVSFTPLHHASWKRQMGIAYIGLSQFGPAMEHLEGALTILRYPIPTARPEIMATATEREPHKLSQFLWSDEIREHSSSDPEVAMEAVRIYDQLPEVYFSTRGQFAMTEAIIRTINLAEVVGPPPALARSCSLLSAGCCQRNKPASRLGICTDGRLLFPHRFRSASKSRTARRASD
jgi:hypothetical protein